MKRYPGRMELQGSAAYLLEKEFSLVGNATHFRIEPNVALVVSLVVDVQMHHCHVGQQHLAVCIISITPRDSFTEQTCLNSIELSLSQRKLKPLVRQGLVFHGLLVSAQTHS